MNCPQCNEELVLEDVGFAAASLPPIYRFRAKCVNGHSSVRCTYDGKVEWFHNLDDGQIPAEEFERFMRQDSPPKKDLLDLKNML